MKRIKVKYSWQMLRSRDTEGEDYEDDTQTLQQFALTNIFKDQNLVIAPFALLAGKGVILVVA